MSSPRGRIVCPYRAIPLSDTLTLSARWFGIIVYLRADVPARVRKDFKLFCRANGIHARVVQRAGTSPRKPGEEPDDYDNPVGDGIPVAWECIGGESVAAVPMHPAVRDWHWILNVKPPIGTSAPSPHAPIPSDASTNVRRVIKDNRSPKAERLAREERDRRASLSKDERAELEAAELERMPGTLRRLES
jgi:hypothetical protein